jgi:aspartyl-tRNA synthetase
MENFDVDPGSALAYAYDLVCNGSEIAGGVDRIPPPRRQERVFEVMGLNADEARRIRLLLDARLRLRGATARRHRVQLGPDQCAALRHRLYPRRHRVPEDRRRIRPVDDRSATPITATAARGGRRRQNRNAAASSAHL